MSSTVEKIEILNADDTELMRISREGTLSLNLNEMRTIQTHFLGLGRNPTDVEIETIAQTWSEHCVTKRLRASFFIPKKGKNLSKSMDCFRPLFNAQQRK